MKASLRVLAAGRDKEQESILFPLNRNWHKAAFPLQFDPNLLISQSQRRSSKQAESWRNSGEEKMLFTISEITLKLTNIGKNKLAALKRRTQYRCVEPDPSNTRRGRLVDNRPSLCTLQF